MTSNGPDLGRRCEKVGSGAVRFLPFGRAASHLFEEKKRDFTCRVDCAWQGGREGFRVSDDDPRFITQRPSFCFFPMVLRLQGSRHTIGFDLVCRRRYAT